MYENIVGSIICTQFESIFGRYADFAEFNSRNRAMQVTFHLTNNYDVEDGYRHVEDGYRHLTLLLFSGGNRYVAVYAKADWDVTPNNPEGTDEDNLPYVKGETPWVCYGYHDSCWRESVETILREYHGKVVTIDSLFNGKTGWYKSVELTDEQIEGLRSIRNARYEGKGPWVWHKLSELEFQFPATITSCSWCSWCPVPSQPDPLHHPDGQVEHIQGE